MPPPGAWRASRAAGTEPDDAGHVDVARGEARGRREGVRGPAEAILERVDRGKARRQQCPPAPMRFGKAGDEDWATSVTVLYSAVLKLAKLEQK